MSAEDIVSEEDQPEPKRVGEGLSPGEQEAARALAFDKQVAVHLKVRETGQTSDITINGEHLRCRGVEIRVVAGEVTAFRFLDVYGIRVEPVDIVGTLINTHVVEEEPDDLA